MFEKMTDGEVMVYLRNAALQISELARERNMLINIRCREGEYFCVEAEDYEVSKLPGHDEVEYAYRPTRQGESMVDKWKYNLKPCQIRFNALPEEVPYGQ